MSLPSVSLASAAAFLAAALTAVPAASAFQELLYSNDFSADTVGQKPVGFDHVRPVGDNVGTELPFPIAWEIENGPVGALIVGDTTSPAPALPGAGNRSLRIYDYTSQGDARAYVSKNFVVNATNNRPDARVDLQFRRSTFIQQELAGDVLVIALGEFVATGQSFNMAANRAVTVRLDNEGRWSVGGELSGDYNGDAVNDLTIVANAHEADDLTYDGPAGAATLPTFAYSLYLNGERVAEAVPFENNFKLGKFGFMTGNGQQDAEIDFVVDNLAIYGLRDTPFVGFELDYTLDFEDQTVGAEPSGGGVYFRNPASPTVGGIIVDDTSDVPSINGLSVRLFDEDTGDRMVIEDNFIPGPDDGVADIRFDFHFRRAAALPRSGNDGLYASMGGLGSGMFLHTNARRALEVRIFNDGTLLVGGNGTSDVITYEPFDEFGDHQISFFANSQPDGVTYLAPDGNQRALDGFSFSTFLNGELIDENRGFRVVDDVMIEQLGRFGFVTGVNMASTGIDFVVDDIRLTQFLDAGGPVLPELPRLSINRGETPGTVRISFPTEAGAAYRLRFSTNLTDWSDVGEVLTGDGSVAEQVLDTGAAGRGFYRLVLVDG